MPPEGAPNVLLILIDDAGFGSNSAFGGLVPTPTLDKLAKRGLRYTQMHNTALCSPTRAALLTGRNHHGVGFGTVAEAASGYPGYDSITRPETAHGAAALKENGYSTAWFGKNHNVPTWEASPQGPFEHWPVGQGYDYFYGFIGGDTSQWQPGNLYRNTTPIHPYNGKPGWNLITAMADDCIEYISTQTSTDPKRPWFIHYAPGATHAPHHPTPGVDQDDRGHASLRRRLERGRRAHLREPEEARRRAGERQAAALAGLPAEVGDADGRPEEALSAPDQRLGRLHGLYRPRDRPRSSRTLEKLGPVRQHADPLGLRRQRHERRRLDERHAERGRLFQRLSPSRSSRCCR